MKCKHCEDVGELFVPGRIIKCPYCQSVTSGEYMRSCSSDELVSILCELVDSGILQEWRIKYHCADSDEDAVRMWLKEKHK